MAVKEGLLPEDHARQHTAQAPHIQTIVIHLKHTDSTSLKSNFPEMQLYEIQTDYV